MLRRNVLGIAREHPGHLGPRQVSVRCTRGVRFSLPRRCQQLYGSLSFQDHWGSCWPRSRHDLGALRGPSNRLSKSFRASRLFFSLKFIAETRSLGNSKNRIWGHSDGESIFTGVFDRCPRISAHFGLIPFIKRNALLHLCSVGLLGLIPLFLIKALLIKSLL